MIGEKIAAERLNSFLDLGPPFSYIALGTAVGFAGSSSSETSDTLICRKSPGNSMRTAMETIHR
jgi:hypothetical protein